MACCTFVACSGIGATLSAYFVQIILLVIDLKCVTSLCAEGFMCSGFNQGMVNA